MDDVQQIVARQQTQTHLSTRQVSREIGTCCATVAASFRSVDYSVDVQGGPAKVRPTYILLVLECADKIQGFFGKYDNSLARHTLWEA